MSLIDHPALIWEDRIYPFKLGSALCFRCVRMSSHTGLDLGRQKQFRLQLLILSQLIRPARACVCFFRTVAKTVPCADAQYPRLCCQGGITWGTLPLYHTEACEGLMVHALPGGIARNASRWLTGSDSLSLAASGQYGGWPWPRWSSRHQSLRRCVLKTRSGQNTVRKCSWIPDCGNRKADHSSGPRCRANTS